MSAFVDSWSAFRFPAGGNNSGAAADTRSTDWGQQFDQITDNFSAIPQMIASEATEIATTDSVSAAPGAYVGPFADKNIAGEPVAVWLGLIGLIAILRYIASREDIPVASKVADVKLGGYSVVSIGLTAVVFIFAIKVFFNWVKAPGITAFVNVL